MLARHRLAFVALAAFGCAARVRRDHLRTVRGIDSSVATDVRDAEAVGPPAEAMTSVPLDTASSTAATAPAARPPGVCGITFRAPIHLRATADAATRGPEWPGGTRARVLAVTTLGRLRSNRFGPDALASVLTHLQIEGSGDVGYAFVRPVEFDADCPVLVVEPALPAYPDVIDGRRHPTRDAAIRARRRNGRFDGPTPLPPGPFDVDGDGRRDAVVSVHYEEPTGESGSYRVDDVFGLLRRDERGWQFSFLEPFTNRDCHENCYTQLLQTLRTPGRPFLLYEHCPCGGSPSARCGRDAVPNLFEPEGVYHLHRWVGDGEARLVFTQTIGAVGEVLDWSAEPDGAIRATGRQSRRSQRLVWDEPRRTLVPDGPLIPVVPYEPTRCLEW